MSEHNNQARLQAISTFADARRMASLEQLSSRLTSRDSSLLPFEAIRAELRQQSPRYRGTKQVPLDQIVGSVGRYKDLTRRFLPLNNNMRERWVSVAALATTTGWPPVDLYKVGDVYFVRDGNHRVSAARMMKLPAIEAEVWEFTEDVKIGPEDSLDEILIRLGERNFFELTGLKLRYVDCSIRFTSSGRYVDLLAQIEALRATLAALDEQPFSRPEAAAAWYEIVYLPTVQIIRDEGLLSEFPGRTEADLFVWLLAMREPLQEVYGEQESLAALAGLLAVHCRESVLKRTAQRLRLLLDKNAPPS